MDTLDLRYSKHAEDWQDLADDFNKKGKYNSMRDTGY